MNILLITICAVFVFVLLFIWLPASAHRGDDPSGMASAWGTIYMLIFIGISLLSSLFTLPFYFYKVSETLYFIPTILNILLIMFSYIIIGKRFLFTITLSIVPLIFASLCCFLSFDKTIFPILFVIIVILLFMFFIRILLPQLRTMRVNNIIKIIKTKNINKFKNIKKSKKNKSIAKDYLYAQVERGYNTCFVFLSAEDINDYQLLNRAVYMEKRDMMQYFIEKGADINIKDEYGRTPLDYAKSEEMKQLLISHGAKSGEDLK